MITSWLTLRDLEYVIAVAKHEHFGRAAQECHVSQPSLSTQIKKIEGYLATTLFERTNRRVSTTAAGKKVAEQAAVVLAEARKISTLLEPAALDRFETLKLGCITTLAPFIPYAITELKKAFPQASLLLQEGLTHELIRELKVGNLDAVIAAAPIKDESLTKIPLFFEPFLLAAPNGHAILKSPAPKISELRPSDMVLLEEGHCLRDQTLGFCPVNRRGTIKSFHATSLETLRHLVASGAGYTLMPRLGTQGRDLENLMSYLEFEDDRVGRKVILLCRNQSGDLSSFRRLARTLVQAVPKKLGLREA